jgi:alpha-beta hydrolase superfamily lysophospholipase
MAAVITVSAHPRVFGTPDALVRQPRMSTPADSGHGTVVARDGVSIAWRAFLPERARATFVVVHGAAEHGGRYGDLVDRLTASRCAVFCPDLRGHGRSGGRRAGVKRFEQFVNDLHHVVEEVVAPHGSLPRFVLGYSLGGAVVVRYALRYQDSLSGIVLAAPAIGLGPEFSRTAFAAARALRVAVPRLRLIGLTPETMMQDPQRVRRYRADPLVHHGKLESSLIGETMRAMAALPAQIRELTVPLLILHGEDDTSADPEGSRTGLEQAGSADKELHLYSGVRHDVFNEPGREAVLEDLIAWVDRQLGAGSASLA